MIEGLSFQVVPRERVTPQLLQELLSAGMYEESFLQSRFKAFYQESIACQKPTKEVSLVIAKSGGSPVGVSLFEWMPEMVFPLVLRESQFASSSPIKKQLDKSFQLLGWFQVYVAPEYRKQGVASNLAKQMNELIFSDLRNVLPPHHLPLVIAKGRAYEIARLTLPQSYLLKSNPPYVNLERDLHRLTQDYMNDAMEGVSVFQHESLKNFKISDPPPVRERIRKLRIRLKPGGSL